MKGSRIAVIAWLAMVPVALAEPLYHLTDLGTLGGSSSWATAINDSGQIAGGSSMAGTDDSHAFLYSGGRMTDLGTLQEDVPSYGTDINDNGWVVGYCYSPYVGFTRAFLYDGLTMRDVGTLGGADSWGWGINNYGKVTGQSGTTGNHAEHAFIYNGYTNTMEEDLGILSPGGWRSLGFGINDSDQVVGQASTDAGWRAFFWDGSPMISLGTLGGNTSAASRINNAGQIIGVSNLTWDGPYHGFVYDLYDGLGMRDLGTLGGDNSDAMGINDFGAIVGQSNRSPGGALHAFLYERSAMYDLSLLLDSSGAGWDLRAAYDVNNLGQIVGTGVTPDGSAHAVLLTPVPEPAALSLLSVGALVLIRRRYLRARETNLL